MCESEGEGAWITYAVPEDWENNSRGGGGSGSPLSTSLDLGFDLPDGGRVNVELDTEPCQPDGSITTRSGESFEGFDYDYSVGDDSTTIAFDSLGMVAAVDQDIEVWVAPRGQAPDFLTTTEHRARFEVASLSNPAAGDDDGYMPASYILTVVHNPRRGGSGRCGGHHPGGVPGLAHLHHRPCPAGTGAPLRRGLQRRRRGGDPDDMFGG